MFSFTSRLCSLPICRHLIHLCDTDFGFIYANGFCLGTPGVKAVERVLLMGMTSPFEQAVPPGRPKVLHVTYRYAGASVRVYNIT